MMDIDTGYDGMDGVILGSEFAFAESLIGEWGESLQNCQIIPYPGTGNQAEWILLICLGLPVGDADVDALRERSYWPFDRWRTVEASTLDNVPESTFKMTNNRRSRRKECDMDQIRMRFQWFRTVCSIYLRLLFDRFVSISFIVRPHYPAILTS